MSDNRKGLLILELLFFAFAATQFIATFIPNREYWIFAGAVACAAIIYFVPLLQWLAVALSTLLWTTLAFFVAGGPAGIHNGASILAAAAVLAILVFVTRKAEQAKGGSCAP